MQQLKIIFFIIVIFFASSFWLFYASDRFVDPNQGKNWWALEFQDPKSDSLNVVLKNHAQITEFELEVLRDEEKIFGTKISSPKGEEKIIEIDESLNFSKEGRLTVRVTAAEEKREVYKNY